MDFYRTGRGCRVDLPWVTRRLSGLVPVQSDGNGCRVPRFGSPRPGDEKHTGPLCSKGSFISEAEGSLYGFEVL